MIALYVTDLVGFSFLSSLSRRTFVHVFFENPGPHPSYLLQSGITVELGGLKGNTQAKRIAKTIMQAAKARRDAAGR